LQDIQGITPNFLMMTKIQVFVLVPVSVNAPLIQASLVPVTCTQTITCTRQCECSL